MASSRRILILDRDDGSRSSLVRSFSQAGFEARDAAPTDEGIRLARELEFDAVLVGVGASDMPDLEAVERLCRTKSAPAVLALVEKPPTGDVAARLLQAGAFFCLDKETEFASLHEMTNQAIRRRELEQENEALRRIASQHLEVGGGKDRIGLEPVICESPEMKEVVAKMKQVAPSSAAVLISGETGSGKGLIAWAIHHESPRASQPFIHVNCSAVQPELLESEFFGHERGAFTGAVASKPGLVEVAHGGTLFLDEIGEMSPAMQAKLLQVLDTGELRRVGGTRLRKVNARIVTATNRDLKAEVREGRFRKDLFFRLNVVAIEVPPLCRRREDIPGLVDLLLERFQAPGSPPKSVSRRVIQLMMEYHWPGNVRELSNVMESACLLAPGESILPEDLPPSLQPHSSFETGAIDVPLPLVEMERLHIARVLEFTDGKKAAAARLLGIDVKTLSRKVKAFGIEP